MHTLQRMQRCVCNQGGSVVRLRHLLAVQSMSMTRLTIKLARVLRVTQGRPCRWVQVFLYCCGSHLSIKNPENT